MLRAYRRRLQQVQHQRLAAQLQSAGHHFQRAHAVLFAGNQTSNRRANGPPPPHIFAYRRELHHLQDPQRQRQIGDDQRDQRTDQHEQAALAPAVQAQRLGGRQRRGRQLARMRRVMMRGQLLRPVQLAVMGVGVGAGRRLQLLVPGQSAGALGGRVTHGAASATGADDDVVLLLLLLGVRVGVFMVAVGVTVVGVVIVGMMLGRRRRRRLRLLRRGWRVDDVRIVRNEVAVLLSIR